MNITIRKGRNSILNFILFLVFNGKLSSLCTKAAPNGIMIRLHPMTYCHSCGSEKFILLIPRKFWLTAYKNYAARRSQEISKWIVIFPSSLLIILPKGQASSVRSHLHCEGIYIVEETESFWIWGLLVHLNTSNN